MINEERDKALYRYPDPDGKILRNKLDIRDSNELKAVEARLVTRRIVEGSPTGPFDLDHLRSFHHHLFQDVYEWAGETRQTLIKKGGYTFALNPPFDQAMHDVQKRLSKQDYLQGLKPEKFAAKAAEVIGDVNRLHPFREGNGRTQFQYLKQLGAQAGHPIDLTRFERQSWIRASIEANKFQSERMEQCIHASLVSNPKTVNMERLREQARTRRKSQDDDYGEDP